MNIIIPVGGRGERFSKAGYTKPKPLIEISDKTMIEKVLSNINIRKNDIVFIIYKEDLDNYNFSELITKKYPEIKLITLTNDTKGAAETLLFGLNYIFNNYKHNKKSLILDCDTFYGEDIINMFNESEDNTVFYSKTDYDLPIYSYIEMDNNSNIIKIVEKQKISNNANTGAYGFSDVNKLHEYCKYVIENNITFNNEPYTSCVINEMLKNDYIFKGKNLNASYVYSLGTPLDLQKYMRNAYSFLFDLDGTLVLTDDIYLKVWSDILLEYNIILTQELFNSFIQGNTDNYVIQKFKLHVELENLSKKKDEGFIKNINMIKLIPGSIEFLKLIKKHGHNCCIVTNCNKKVAKGIIELYDFDKYIDFFISSDDCKFGKPNPEPYLNAINKYKINHQKCFIFEDSKSGLLSARQVNPKLLIGIETVFNKENLIKNGADITLQDYKNYNLDFFFKIKNNNLSKLKQLIKRQTALNVKNISISDTHLKGGFIADVIKVKIEEHSGELYHCVFKYENKNENNLSFMANKLQLYGREYYFYEKISPQINVKIPKFIDVIKNDDNEYYGILLEDLFMNPNLKINLNLNIESLDISLKIINKFAAMHAKFWNKNLNQIYPKLKKNNDVIFFPFLNEFISEKIILFKEKWNKVLTPSQLELSDKILENFHNIQNNLSRENLTIVHGDIKSPNIFFDTVNKEPYFLDWQHCCIGKGTQDLIFFVLESFDSDNLKLFFPLFKIYYYKMLLENGITDYTFQKYENDIKDSISYVPFFTSVWFGTLSNEELIDKNWPFFFIQKTFWLLENS